MILYHIDNIRDLFGHKVRIELRSFLDKFGTAEHYEPNNVA